MRKNLWRLLQIFVVTAGVLSCTGANLYKDLASNKDSDEALYEEAQKLIDGGMYSEAITTLLSTTSTFQSQVRFKESLAGAYAARCGMEFIPFVNNLTGGSSSSFYSLAMNGFVGVNTNNYADCKTAEGLIEGIGTLTQRSQSQNLFLLVLEMAKIGNRVRHSVDILPTSVGDGNVDAGFNCNSSVTTANAQEIIESLYKFITLFGKVSVTLSGVDDLEAAIDAIKDDLPALDYSGGGNAGVDDLDNVIIVSRTLMNIRDFGVGSCNGDLTTCVCVP